MRSDGRYVATIQQDGKRKYFYGKSQREADRKAKAFLGRSDVLEVSDTYLLKEAYKDVISVCIERTSLSTQWKYGKAFERVSSLHEKDLNDIKQTDVQRIINKHSDHPDNQKMIKQLVNLIYVTAIADGRADRNPASGIKLRRTPTPPKHRALTEEERASIFRCVDETFTEEETAIVLTLFYTGIRTEELLALRYDDMQDGQVVISRALTFKGGSQIKEPKTQAAFRTIPIPSDLQERVKGKSGLLVSNMDGGLVSETVWKRKWYAILTKITGQKIWLGKDGKTHGKDTDLTPYCFRHNFATILCRNHIDIKTAQRLTGHQSARTLLDIYTHASETIPKIEY